MNSLAYFSKSVPTTTEPSSIFTVRPFFAASQATTNFVPVTCTGITDAAGDGAGNGYASVTAGTEDELTGCTVPTQYEGDGYSSNSMIAAPGAALVSPTTLGLSGEGSSKSAKLFGNNEDYEVLRVAYTTDGVNFSDAGLANNGIISGTAARTGAIPCANGLPTTSNRMCGAPAQTNTRSAASSSDMATVCARAER